MIGPQIEIGGKSRRVALAQTVIESDGVIIGRVQQTLSQIDLEYVPRLDVVHGLLNRRPVRIGCEIAG